MASRKPHRRDFQHDEARRGASIEGGNLAGGQEPDVMFQVHGVVSRMFRGDHPALRGLPVLPLLTYQRLRPATPNRSALADPRTSRSLIELQFSGSNKVLSFDPEVIASTTKEVK